MKINSDINVLGSIEDFHLFEYFLQENKKNMHLDHLSKTSIKTEKSFSRYKKAIKNTVLKYPYKTIESMITKVMRQESISSNTLFLLFWNSSYNNDLIHYLNQHVYFPALFSGRSTLKNDEVEACLKELLPTVKSLQHWSVSTIQIIASKYLTLLKKFTLVEGKTAKSIQHHYFNDIQFFIFLHWLKAIEKKTNMLESAWIPYSLMENEAFVQRIIQKQYKKWVEVFYTGTNLSITLIKSFEEGYNELIQS